MYIFWMLAALFVHLREYRSGRFHTLIGIIVFPAGHHHTRGIVYCRVRFLATSW